MAKKINKKMEVLKAMTIWKNYGVRYAAETRQAVRDGLYDADIAVCPEDQLNKLASNILNLHNDKIDATK